MVSKEVSKKSDQRVTKEEGARHEGKFLSARWMVCVASAILTWISLMPVVWIDWLLVGRSMIWEAVLLGVCGLTVFGWNLHHLRLMLHNVFSENGLGEVGGNGAGRLAKVFGVQIVLAAACTHLAGPFNPIGMQQWFWMPTAGFAGVLLRKRVHMILVLIGTLFVSTVHENAVRGQQSALFWMCGQITTSVFIMGCAFAMTQVSRQRLSVARVADELRTANAWLELQADHAAVNAVEQERSRLAREIHDAVGHSFTVVGAQLDVAEALMHESPAQALDSIQKAQRTSREGLAEIRRSITNLRTAAPAERTLVESLTSLITAAERPGLKLALQQSGKSRSLPALVEMSLYRCAQEGITNACRHSGGSEIAVHLDFTSDDRVSLSVTDNGRGFSKIPESGHGLSGLRERALLLNGEFFAGTDLQGGGYCRMVIPA